MRHIKIYGSAPGRPPKAVNGVNNLPISHDGTINQMHSFRKLGIPFVRLHDQGCDNTQQVDIPKIFPDFYADPEDPASYRFGFTDQIVTPLIDSGAQAIYRLGVEIEHAAIKLHVFPPEDPEQWARICLGIIRHYNEGWADGFHYGIRRWEIWNEPDIGAPMWYGGTAEQYYRLYTVAAKRIKQAYPTLMVGGYAGCNPAVELPYREQFFQYINREKAPLDFYSWHAYENTPEKILGYCEGQKAVLDRYGRGDAEILLDEWNYMEPTCWELVKQPGSEYKRREIFERVRSAFGASFAAAVMILAQEQPVDILNYYDTQPSANFCGLYDRYGVPAKPYYAFLAYRALDAVGGHTLRVECAAPYYAMAVRGAAETCVLLACHGKTEGDVLLELSGLPEYGKRAEYFLLDQTHDLTCERTEYYHGGTVAVRLSLPEYAVALLRISPAADG